MAALREVIERQGLFCALYSDRGSHFWHTPKAGGKVDPMRLTQVCRAMRDLRVQMIPAYSPQDCLAGVLLLCGRRLGAKRVERIWSCDKTYSVFHANPD